MMLRHCLKCGSENPNAQGAIDDACPACGAIYTKVEKVLALKAKLDAEKAAQAKRASQTVSQKPITPPTPVATKKPRVEGNGLLDAWRNLPSAVQIVIAFFGFCVLSAVLLPLLSRQTLTLFLICGGLGLFIVFRGAAAKKMIICPNPNCGYHGAAHRVSRGNTVLGLILCLFFLVPGLLYFMFKSGYRYFCPKCGLQIAADN